jgi:hypothetical protein
MNPLSSLPIDALAEVYSYVGGAGTLFNLACVSKATNQTIFAAENDTTLWGQLCLVDFGYNLAPAALSPSFYRKKWQGLYTFKKSPQTRKEFYSLSDEDARSVIEMERNFGFALKVNSQMVSFSFPHFWGESLIRIFVEGKRLGDSFEEDIAQVRYFFDEGIIDSNESMVDQLKPLLRLFSGGKYHIVLHYKPSICTRNHPFESSADDTFSYSSNFSTVSMSFYDLNCERRVIKTQSEDWINPDRVEFYRNRIRQKKFPIIFAIYVNSDELYILDGHHKYKAYEEESSVNPVFLTIQPFSDYLQTQKNYFGDYTFYCLNFCGWENGDLFQENSKETEYCSASEELLARYRNSFHGFKSQFNNPNMNALVQKRLKKLKDGKNREKEKNGFVCRGLYETVHDLGQEYNERLKKAKQERIEHEGEEPDGGVVTGKNWDDGFWAPVWTY